MPQAGAVVMAYTGQSGWTPDCPPTYSAVGDRDGIASAAAMQRRIANLQNAEAPAKIQVYPNVRHGFGLGIGTSAEGWMEGAVDF